MGDETKKVISHEDGVKILKRVTEMQESIEAADEATKLSLSERADDMAKAVAEVTAIAKSMEEAQQKFGEEQRRAALESGDGAMGGMLDRFKGGYRAPRGDEEEYGAKTFDAPTIKNLIEGVHLSTGEEFYAPEHENIDRLRTLNDNALIQDQIMRLYHNDSYQRRGGIASLDSTKEAKRMAEAMFKSVATDMVDTTDLANWVPDHFTGELFDNIRLATPEMGLFRQITMPGKVLDLNVNLTDPEATMQVEITTNVAANPFADANMQVISDSTAKLDAVKARSRVVFSGEVEEDAIVAQLPFYRQMLTEGMSNALADAIINGDAGTADLDDTASSDTHYGKACPAAGVDARRLWDGLRSFCADNTAVPDTETGGAGSDVTSDMMGIARATMGEYGVDQNKLIQFVSPRGYLTLLRDGKVITQDLVGSLATILTGSLDRLWGSPLIISRRMPDNMASTGKIGTVGSVLTQTITVNRDMAVLGNRRRMTMGMDTYGATDAKDIYLFWRGDFKPLLPVTKPWISSIINITTG